MTNSGGTYNKGVVFSINTNGSDYKKILEFNTSTAGIAPGGSLTLSGTILYGTTGYGGRQQQGCCLQY